MDDKDTGGKYDRQIRLWSSNGQQKLVLSNVLMIGGSVTGTEVLKNLILPGVGNISIIDTSIVSPIDLAGNFFLDEDDLHTPMAKALCKNLADLNPDVKFNPLVKELGDFQSNFWSQFNCVINTTEDSSIDDILWDLGVPLIKISTIGFYSYLRIQIKHQFIIETHDNDLNDLRIDSPWPQLQEYIDSIDDSETNIPYSIIITKLFQRFQKDNNGKRPKPVDIRKMAMGKVDLDEVSKRASVVLKDSNKIPDNLKRIFANIGNQTSLEWNAVRGLRDFYEEFNLLPLSGVIPDMESQTDQYIKLKEIFKEKHQTDKQMLLTLISKYTDGAQINDNFLSTFTKNCKFMTCINGSKLKPNINKSILKENSTGLPIYLSFQLVENFFKQNKRYPCIADDKNLSILNKIKLAFLNDSVTIDSTICDDILMEMMRSNGKELHNISSIMGGIAAQEVIKILTNHYIPLDNCLVFDGIKGEGYSLKI